MVTSHSPHDAPRVFTCAVGRSTCSLACWYASLACRQMMFTKEFLVISPSSFSCSTRLFFPHYVGPRRKQQQRRPPRKPRQQPRSRARYTQEHCYGCQWIPRPRSGREPPRHRRRLPTKAPYAVDLERARLTRARRRISGQTLEDDTISGSGRYRGRAQWPRCLRGSLVRRGPQAVDGTDAFRRQGYHEAPGANGGRRNRTRNRGRRRTRGRAGPSIGGVRAGFLAAANAKGHS